VIYHGRRIARGTREGASARSEDSLRIEPIEDLAEINRAEWDRLARESGNLFATPEWILAWWEAFGDQRSLLSFSCRAADGSLVALLPMYVAPRRELRFLGHGLADCLGPVCAPSDRPAVARAMTRALRQSRRQFDRFVGDDLPEQHAWGLALRARTVRRTSSPVLLSRGSDWASYLNTRSANFRQQACRRERRLARHHALRYRLVNAAARLDADFDELLRLHDARWRGSSGSFAGRRTAFHRAFAARAFDRGWLRLWIAELDGRPAAAWYGFRFADAEWYYQAGRDRRYDSLSIGFVLLVHTIREALADGIVEYKLLRGDEAYKRRFANDDAPLETVMIASENLHRNPGDD
jgi:CelD/BcsL family acetyltransferase involved in cellulose biosynthesis